MLGGCDEKGQSEKRGFEFESEHWGQVASFYKGWGLIPVQVTQAKIWPVSWQVIWNR